MSNPGVILLAAHTKSSGCFEKIRIEDNIGESIHIHLDDFRIDLTIKEFELFSKIIWRALQELDDLPDYLKESNFLSDIYKATNYKKPEIDIKNTKIGELSFIKRTSFLRFFYLYGLVNIKETPQYLYLKNHSNEYESYPQKNYLGISNVDRLESRSASLSNKNIKNDPYAVVFGKNSLVVRDGMHTCSIIAHKSGKNSYVDVLHIKNIGYREQINQPILWSIKSVIGSTFLF